MPGLIMTLLARNEADIIKENIDFHLERGVDYVIATDNASDDETQDILREYERLGCLKLIIEEGRDKSQWSWVTRMARLASDDYRADWVLNNDADEFWIPTTGNLKELIEDTVSDLIVAQRINLFYPYDATDATDWIDRIVYRATRPLSHGGRDEYVSLVDRLPYFYYKLPPKILFRPDHLVSVAQGNHSAIFSKDITKESGDVRVYHVPFRDNVQFLRKMTQTAEAYKRNKDLPATAGWHHRHWYELYCQYGAAAALSDALPSKLQLEDHLAQGVVVRDDRLKIALGERE